MSDAPDWTLPQPSAPQIAALMACGVTGLMIPGLQPLLLGGLAEQGRLTANELGIIATAELLVMGITAGLAGSFLKASRLKLIALASLVVLASIDALTPLAPSSALLALRAAAGAPSGLLVWLTIAMIARMPTPERWAGVYVTAQTAGQFVMAALISGLVAPRQIADGGFIALALLCALTLLAIFWIPAELAPLPEAATTGLPSARGWIALAVSFLFLAVTSGAWVYLERLSHQAHHAAGVAGEAISISLACQIAGGIAATLLAGRVHWFRILSVCAVIDLGLFAAFATLPGAVAFIALSSVLGFVWLFATPFLVPLTIEADPTRRAALLIGGAQLVGGSLGPLFASFFVTDTDARGVLAFSVACLSIAGALFVWLHITRARAT